MGEKQDSGFGIQESEERFQGAIVWRMVNYELLCCFLAVLATHCLTGSPFKRG